MSGPPVIDGLSLPVCSFIVGVQIASLPAGAAGLLCAGGRGLCDPAQCGSGWLEIWKMEERELNSMIGGGCVHTIKQGWSHTCCFLYLFSSLDCKVYIDTLILICYCFYSNSLHRNLNLLVSVFFCYINFKREKKKDC